MPAPRQRQQPQARHNAPKVARLSPVAAFAPERIKQHQSAHLQCHTVQGIGAALTEQRASCLSFNKNGPVPWKARPLWRHQNDLTQVQRARQQHRTTPHGKPYCRHILKTGANLNSARRSAGRSGLK